MENYSVGKLQTWTAVVAVMIVLASCAGTQEARRGGGTADTTARQKETAAEPLAVSTANLRDLIIDISEARAPELLSGLMMTLSSGGSASQSGSAPSSGNILIRNLTAQKTAPEQLKVEVSGMGWLWISREQKKLGATFNLDEYARFNVNIVATGTFDFAYDTEKHIVTAWIIPTDPVQVDLNVTGNIDVDTEGLWSGIVGAAADIIGGSIEQRAEKSIEQKGSRKFEARLEKGMTVILDLCSGQRFMEFGTLTAGTIPDTAEPAKNNRSLTNGTGELHRNGLLITGPYDTKNEVLAQISVSEGSGVYATLVCEDDARVLAEAYASGKALPSVHALGEDRITAGSDRRLGVAAEIGCKVMLVMRPLEETDQAIKFTYRVDQTGTEHKPLADCP